MSDIKIFKIQNQTVNEIKGTSVALEKSLQDLMEKNLEEILGIRFLKLGLQVKLIVGELILLELTKMGVQSLLNIKGP